MKHKHLIFILLIFTSLNLIAQDWIEKTPKKLDYDLKGFKILVFIGHNFDYYEAIYIPDILAQMGAEVVYAGTAKEVQGFVTKKEENGFNYDEKRTVKPDILIKEAYSEGFHMLYFPGGEGVFEMLENEKTKKILLKECSNAYRDYKLIAGMSEGVLMLAENFLLENTEFVSTSNVSQRIKELGGIEINKKAHIYKDLLTGRWPFFEDFAHEAGKFLNTRKIKIE